MASLDKNGKHLHKDLVRTVLESVHCFGAVNVPDSHLFTLGKLVFELTTVKLCAGVSVDSVYSVVVDKIPELGKGT